MTTETKSAPIKRMGRPPTPIPDTLRSMLDATYDDESHEPAPIEFRKGQSAQARAVLRLARIYARRENKSLRYQLEGRTLWLAMVPRRTYTRKAA